MNETIKVPKQVANNNPKNMIITIRKLLLKAVTTSYAYSGRRSYSDKFKFSINNFKVNNKWKAESEFYLRESHSLFTLKHSGKKIFVCKWKAEIYYSKDTKYEIKEVVSLDTSELENIVNLIDLISTKIDLLGQEV